MRIVRRLSVGRSHTYYAGVAPGTKCAGCQDGPVKRQGDPVLWQDGSAHSFILNNTCDNCQCLLPLLYKVRPDES